MKKIWIALTATAVLLAVCLLAACGQDAPRSESTSTASGDFSSFASETESGRSESDALSETLSSATDETSSEFSEMQSEPTQSEFDDETEPSESDPSQGDESEESEDPSQSVSDISHESSYSGTQSEATQSTSSETSSEPIRHTHQYKASIVQPTCTEKGYTLHKCSCGDSYRDTYTDALGHDPDPWSITTIKQATEMERGKYTRPCMRCKATLHYEEYSGREIAEQLPERVLYWLNYARTQEGLEPVQLSYKLCEFANYRGIQKKQAIHDQSDKNKAAEATQCFYFYDDPNDPHWRAWSTEVCAGTFTLLATVGWDGFGEELDGMDALGKGFVYNFENSKGHWATLMKSSVRYLGVDTADGGYLVLSYADGGDPDEGYWHGHLTDIEHDEQTSLDFYNYDFEWVLRTDEKAGQKGYWHYYQDKNYEWQRTWVQCR